MQHDTLTLFLLWGGTYVGMWGAIGYGLRCRNLLDMHVAVFVEKVAELNSSNDRLRLENEDLRQRLRERLAELSRPRDAKDETAI